MPKMKMVDPDAECAQEGETSSVEGNRIILLFQVINPQSSMHVIGALLQFDRESKEPIWLLINSEGGSVTDGLAIIDTIRGVRSKVNTVVIGRACSMAAVIAACNNNGTRYITRNGSMMLHKGRGEAGGNMKDIVASVEDMKALDEKLISMVATSAKKQKQKVSEDIAQDFFLPARASIDYGIADKIIDKFHF